MKKLIIRSVIFFVIGFIILNLLSQIVINSKYFSKNLSYNVSLKAVKKSKREIHSKVLILGDSIGRQICPDILPNSLAVNGAILMVGHYILTVNAVKKNPEIKYVILLSAPFIINHDFNRRYTYNNFLKAFYSFENFRYFSDLVKKKISNKFLSNIVIFPFFKLSPVPQFNFENKKRKKISPVFSELSIQYLKKLYEFLTMRQIKLFIISPPLRKKQKLFFLNWKYFKDQVKKRGLRYILKDYFSKIIYLDKKYYSKDGIHLDVKFVRNNRENLIYRLFPPKAILQLEREKILPLKKLNN